MKYDLQNTSNRAIVPIAIYDWEFNTANNAEGWTTGNVTATVAGGSYNLTTTSTDPLIISPDNLGVTPSGTYKYVQISLKNNSPVLSARIFFTTTADTTWTQAKSRSFAINPNTTAFSNYIVDMSAVAGWAGTIKRIRIDPLDPATGAGQTVNIDYIKIIETIPNVNEWYFDTDNNFEGWTWGNATATVSGGTLNVTTTSTDPLLISPDNLGITAPSIYKYVHVDMKNLGSSSDISGRIFFITTTDTVWNTAKSKSFSIKADPSYYGSYIVDMSTVAGWTGTIRQIRVDPLDPASSSGKQVKIDFIRVTNNMSYRGVMSPQNGFTAADADTLKNIWRVNVMRWQIMDPNYDTITTAAKYKSFIDNEISQLDNAFNWCEPRGIKILIDLHFTYKGLSKDSGTRVFYNQEANDTLISTWVRLVNRYKGRKSLYGYDLINEPQQIMTPLAGADYQTTINKLGDTIRSIDRKTPIFVAALKGDNPYGFVGLTPFPFTNIVYETHMYVPQTYTLQDSNLVSYPRTGYGKTQLTTELDAVRNFQNTYSTRIHVGEFSVVRWAPGAATWLRDCIDVFEGYGWSWTYHAYKESDHFDLQFDNSPVGTNGAHRYTGPGFTDRYDQVVGYGFSLNQ